MDVAISTAVWGGRQPLHGAGGIASARTVVPSLQVFDRLADAAPAWLDLEKKAPCSPYQRFAWADAWCATLGDAHGRSPVIAVVFDAAERPIALFPFVRDVVCGVRLARFIGGREFNGQLPLLADPAAWPAEKLTAVLREIGRRAGLDGFVLQNQPESWRGQPNPMGRLPRQASPSGLAATDLGTQQPSSKQARKRLRQKTGWLQAAGPVASRRAGTPEEVDLILAAHVRHRTARAGLAGIRPPTADQLAFYRDAADPARPGGAPLELHALWCGPDIVATFGGTGFGGHYSGVILSMDPRPDIARCSPGELLLRRVVADLPGRGYTRFDLGIGDARYKAAFCDTREPLFDTLVPVTWRGGIVVRGLSATLGIKRRLKRSGWTMEIRRRLVAMAVRRTGPDVSRP